jgi:hypothetical protein
VRYADSEEDGEDIANGGDSDAGDGLSDEEDVSDEQRDESDELHNSDSDAERGKGKNGKAPAQGRGNAKKATPSSVVRGCSAKAPTPRAAASSSSKKASTTDVIDLGDENDEEVEHSKAARVRAAPAKGASAAARPAARVGYSAASAVQLDDDIVDDDGFVQPSAGSSARATQQSALRLPGGTTGKKRQLPLSFSQSANPSQSASRKPAANKSLASGWDD